MDAFDSLQRLPIADVFNTMVEIQMLFRILVDLLFLLIFNLNINIRFRMVSLLVCTQLLGMQLLLGLDAAVRGLGALLLELGAF